MENTVQATIDGDIIDDHRPFEFDCPICGKHILCKRDERGNAYHRPWVFHFTCEHGKTALKYCKDDINLWLWYFCFYDQPAGQELRDDWKRRVPADDHCVLNATIPKGVEPTK